jgi:hypothetical protein
MGDPTSVTIRGPLRVHVAGFWAELMRQGYAPSSALHHLYLAAHLTDGSRARGSLSMI